MTNQVFHLLMHLVRQVLKFESPTDKLLSNFFRLQRKLDNSQRNLIAVTIYSILRNYYKLSKLVSNSTPDLIGLTWIKLLKLPSHTWQNIKLIDYQKLVNLNFPNDQESILELPAWLIEQLSTKMSNSEIIELATALNEEAYLDLRINLLKNNLNSAVRELQQYSIEKMLYSPFGIRIKQKISLMNNPLFLKGGVEVQDEASQLAGLLLNPKRNDMVVDFCAGSGGKSLLFGMLMHNTGRIYALDVHNKRLANLTTRASRAGITTIQSLLINDEFDSKLERLFKRADKVFVDAPCSGFGTLRRNPELKFRHNLDSITQLNTKQLSILAQASKLVKDGGYLVYATCSILTQENQDIVNEFITNNPQFELIKANTILKNVPMIDPQGHLVLLPHIHKCDGFFAAIMRNKQ
jgi:16S rRNA (cytosine967-C5)-methyltransferase